MSKITKCLFTGCYKNSFIVASLICLILFACSPKTGNKHIEISLKFDQTIGMEDISQTSSIIKNRLITYGIPEKNINITVKDDIIQLIIEHADNSEGIIFLSTTIGKIEFWETFELKEIINYLMNANSILADFYKDSVIVSENSPQENIKNKESADEDTNSLLSKIEKARQNDPNSLEQYYKENPLFAHLQLAITQGEFESTFSPGPVIGACLLADTSKVNKMLAMEEIQATFPRNLKLLWSAPQHFQEKIYLNLIAIKITSIDGHAPMDGSVIAESKTEKVASGSYDISINMNAEGAKTWSRLTKDNIGKSVAIVMDNCVYSYPLVMNEIKEGQSTISANFTQDEAEMFVSILKFPGLPIKVSLLESKITEESKK